MSQLAPQKKADFVDENVSDTRSDEHVRDATFKKLLGRWARALFRSRGESLQEALAEVIEEHEGDGSTRLSTEEKDMLRNMLTVGEMTVYDVMVPRPDIVAAEMGASLDDIKQMFLRERHTRVPIYAETLDHVRGYIHLKDLVSALSGDESFSMENVLRTIMFVAPSMKVVDLLVQMRLSGEHIAIVVDEYGGTDGLVSLEDLFEEIVGDIQDEHDESKQEFEIVQVSPGVFEMEGRATLDAVAERVERHFVSDEISAQVDTLGGLILLQLGRMPARGEVVEIKDLGRVEIIDVDPRRLQRLRLTLEF